MHIEVNLCRLQFPSIWGDMRFDNSERGIKTLYNFNCKKWICAVNFFCEMKAKTERGIHGGRVIDLEGLEKEE